MAAPQAVLAMEASEDFVMTATLERVCERAQAYLEAGYPVHLSGPAGVGKTTLAMHLAGQRARPTTLIYGDEEFGSADLLGHDRGIVTNRVVDNFIHSVVRTHESVMNQWVDHRLTTACKQGHTLVYDEFSRSKAEANNALLAILEEGLLALPSGENTASYVQVHPEFRAIFTSNPDEFAGVYTPQSALLDRMLTIKLGYYDHATEVAITQQRSGLSAEAARQVVNLVQAAREDADGMTKPSTRACIMLGRILNYRQGHIRVDDPIFVDACLDVLGSSLMREEQIFRLIDTTLGRTAKEGPHEAA